MCRITAQHLLAASNGLHASCFGNNSLVGFRSAQTHRCGHCRIQRTGLNGPQQRLDDGGHLHSAIHFVTPGIRHAGFDRDAKANRALVYTNARAKSRNGGQEKPVTGSPPDPSR